MDILNFISWIRGGRKVNTVDPVKTLIPVGLKDGRRDDDYLSGAISVADLAAQIGGGSTVSTDGLTITGNGTLQNPLKADSSVVSVYCGLDWPAPVYDMSQVVADVFPNYNYPFAYSQDGKTLFLDSAGFIAFQSFGISGINYSNYVPDYGVIDKIMFKGNTGPYGIGIIDFLLADGFTDPLPIELDLNKAGNVTIGNIDAGVNFIKLPRTCGRLGLQSVNSNIVFDLTDIVETANLEIFNCLNVEEIDLSNMVNTGASIDRQGSYFYVGGNPNLKSIILPTNLKTAPYNIGFDTNALNQATVDGILNMLVKLDGTNGTQKWGIYSENIDLAGGLNDAPSPAGLADAATLISRGATVTHN